MHTRALGFLVVASLFTGPAHAQESSGHKPDAPENSRVALSIEVEDGRSAKTRIEIQTVDSVPKVIQKIEDVPSGATSLPLMGIRDGKYLARFSSPGYAGLWQPLNLQRGKVEPDALAVKLFRKRYVVLRYAFNTSGTRALSGKDVKEGRAAVAHWGGLPHFREDWQVWQRSSGGGSFGEVPYLDFHRSGSGFGFLRAPVGTSFEDAKQTPTLADYKCASTKAEKGLLLFCRVQSDLKQGSGYGKVLVEDVTETPPPGVEVIDAP